MAGSDLMIEILKSMRKEMRERFDERGQAFRRRGQALDGIERPPRGSTTSASNIFTVQRSNITKTKRLDVVESTLLTLARQRRHVMKVATQLEGRMAKLEKR